MLRAVAREWLSWVYPFVCELCGRGGLDGCHVCPDCRGTRLSAAARAPAAAAVRLSGVPIPAQLWPFSLHSPQ